jgi:hypothetical protein
MVERSPNAVPVAPLRRREGVFGRKDVWALVSGAVIVLLLYLWLCARDALQEDAATAAKAEPPVRAMLVVGEVEVKPTKADGRRWDIGIEGLPDPRVYVVNRTRNFYRSTKMVKDTLRAEFNEETVEVRAGDEVYLRVDDVDVQLDDLIGEYRFRVTAEMIERGEMELSFAQVKRLTLRFRRL